MDSRTQRMIYQISETRNKILDAAEHMFLSKGLYATTMSQLANEIGISRTSLYRYYRDKQELSLAILVKRMNDIAGYETLEKEFDKFPDGISRIEAYMRKRWLDPDHLDSYRFFAEFDAYYSGSRIPEGFRREMQDLMEPLYDYPLDKYLKQGREDGTVRTDLSRKHLHVIIMNGIRSFHQRLILRGRALFELNEEDDIETVMDEYVKILIDGVRRK